MIINYLILKFKKIPSDEKRHISVCKDKNFLNISPNKNEDGKNNYELCTMNYEFNFSYFCLKTVLTNYGQILGFKENASLLQLSGSLQERDLF